MAMRTTSYVLAKIHMVTKHSRLRNRLILGYVLAKIHMVTKPQIHSNKSLTLSKVIYLMSLFINSTLLPDLLNMYSFILSKPSFKVINVNPLSQIFS